MKTKFKWFLPPIHEKKRERNVGIYMYKDETLDVCYGYTTTYPDD